VTKAVTMIETTGILRFLFALLCAITFPLPYEKWKVVIFLF